MKTEIKDHILQKVFIRKGDNEYAGFSWIFNFKTASLDKFFLDLFCEEFLKETKQYKEIQVCGMEAGALPFLSALVQNSLNVKNAFYIRKSRKKTDLTKLIEGNIRKDLPIFIIDDILNSGNTAERQITILKELGFSVEALFVIVRYKDVSLYEKIKEEGVRIISIFEVNDFKNELGIENIKEKEKKEGAIFSFDWKIELSKPNFYCVNPKSTPILEGDSLYIATDDGSVLKIDKNNGDLIWRYKIGFGASNKKIFSSVAILNNNVYFGGYDGNFYCLDKNSGKRKWVFYDADFIGSSPCISRNKNIVYIGLEFAVKDKKGGVAALNAETGELIWSYYEMKGLTHASPCVSEEMNVVVCGCNDGYIYAFNAKSGKFLWKFKTEGEVKYSGIFCLKRKIVIMASMDGKVYCLKVKTGEIYAIYEARFGFYSNPLLHKDFIVIGSLDKRVYCFDLSTKKEKWFFETHGRIFSSPKKYKDGFLIGSNDGVLYYLDFFDGNLKGKICLSERIVNAPEVDGDTIYVATHAQQLYKFHIVDIKAIENTYINKNYKLMKSGIDVNPFLEELYFYEKNIGKWSLRRAKQIRVQMHTKHINLRSLVYKSDTEISLEDNYRAAADVDYNELDPDTYPYFKKLYSFLEEFADEIGGQLTRAIIVNLEPNKKVYPHIDEGAYYIGKDRYHLILKVEENGSYNVCDGEVQYYDNGELWWFDNKKNHEAENKSKGDRIHVIFDILPIKRSFIKKAHDYLEKKVSTSLY